MPWFWVGKSRNGEALIGVSMRQLPYDYSRCADSKCPLARFCLRYLSPGRPGWQVYTEFPGGEGCHGFIDANES